MEEFESFTIYTQDNIQVSDLENYSSDFSIEEVWDQKSVFDLVPLEKMDGDKVERMKEVIVSDPKITYLEENFDEAWFEDDFSDPYSNQKSAGNKNKHLPGTENRTWHFDILNIEEAWETVRERNAGLGRGIKIAHPDSGYINHRELCIDGDNRIRTDLDKDFIGIDDYDAHYEHATHGLGTASVIMGNADGVIKGVAPEADLIPLRVARVKMFGITPVLFAIGKRRLRKAIEYAIQVEADIISISLGGIKNPFAHRAFKRVFDKAKEKGILVLAASGNIVKSYGVVWPARFDSVIAVAASNIENKAWADSCNGPEVDFTAPGESVWKAKKPDLSGSVKRGSGTSYAVANSAGIAALWLSYHGKENLIEIFGITGLVDGFKKMVNASINRKHQLPDQGFGSGIIDANALLKLDPADFV